MSKRYSCHWCGSELTHDHEDHAQGFCTECHETYEAEAHRSLHPVEERHPHND
ncbi:MAG: hypothetical protein ACOY93_23525 [Bacillota bacterium]